ncbi:hypothetical protein A2773_05365 [Candidatus Gottesmanbacteria bacterium RIFCSPHIGHO2_01_FULL_39_10]|uniref:SpoVT-AbrB domain-containing protein n=1 Tax=Candidatus Gottesmanbacteria bacterium RIFCSPHIGHO2_01_FULL_39_10 TaxID=1798375 RepID=A0A1F5ZNR6_9BACT|nr:MAG: hypothetical protein A2773_05365 [Candidatus Gottesmanbacteria bacterium RIFCSPHIGHO2_01_FULL_39_10]
MENQNFHISMQISTENIIRILPKGVVTIPKKIRELVRLEENELARIKVEKGRLIIEPVRTLPYPVRSYTEKEIDEFIALDKKETKELKKRKLL